MPGTLDESPRTAPAARRRRCALPSCLSAGLILLALLADAGPLLASSVEVRLKLPVRARIDLENRNTILPAPFIVVSQEGSGNLRGTDIDVQKEFERYLHKVLRRETDLRVIDPTPVDYPTYDLDMLSREKDFWAVLGERAKADLILVGSLDFDIQDRSGYKTEEYVSPFNGQTYYRQVLVEQTGFEYDIVVQVYDGRDGELLYTDNFKDFKAFETEKADPLRGMFENLYALEDRVVNIFAQKEVEASRILLSE
ncbi:MAG TPA: hypothetical protein VMT85_05955 [Thermoanaerobaculia bacterium]|nr:hypothetical protein [Thermoanaerobaculia bacterium]